MSNANVWLVLRDGTDGSEVVSVHASEGGAREEAARLNRVSPMMLFTVESEELQP